MKKMTQRKTIFYLIIAFAILVTITALALNYIPSNDVNTIVNTTKKEIKSDSLDMTFLGDCSPAPYFTISCYHDNDRNITYYIFNNKGGISCIPDEQIKERKV